MILGSRQNYFGIHFDPGYNPGPETSVRFTDGVISSFNVSHLDENTVQLLRGTSHSYRYITDLCVGSSVTSIGSLLNYSNGDGQHAVSNILIPSNVKIISSGGPY